MPRAPGADPLHLRCEFADFWGGVYKRFYVRGPRWYSVQIARNHSFNTILSAHMLDPVGWGICGRMHGLREETPPSENERAARAILQEEYTYRRSQFLQRVAPAETASQAADRLMDELDWTFLRNTTWWAQNSRPYYAALARWYRHHLRPNEATGRQYRETARLASCYYRLGLYRRWEQGLGLLGITTPRAIHRSRRWDPQKHRIYAVPVDH